MRIVASPACRCRPNFFLRVLEGLRCGSPSSRNASCSRLPMPVFCMGNGRAVHLVNNSGARGIRQLRAWPPPLPRSARAINLRLSASSRKARTVALSTSPQRRRSQRPVQLPRARSGDDNTVMKNGLRDLSCTEWTEQTHTHMHKHTDIRDARAWNSLSLSPSLSLLSTQGGKRLYSEDVSSGYIYLILAAALQIQGSWNTLVYEVCVAMYALLVCVRAIPGCPNFLGLVERVHN